MSMAFRHLVLAALVAAVSSCGVVYTSPTVSDGTFFETDYDVEVIDLTLETARAANIDPYIPQRLPIAYDPKAVADEIRALPPLPNLPPFPEPTVLPSERPETIPERFPPLGSAKTYRIGVNDTLLLSVNTAGTSLEDLPGLISAQSKRQGYVVQDDGSIAVPDVGRIRVSGLTLEEAEAEIFQALVTAGIDPSFSLEVADFGSKSVSVSGEVGRTGLIPLRLNPLYLHEAIELSGGVVSPDPSVSVIRLQRGAESYQITLDTYRSDPRARQIILQDDDSIFVTSEYRLDLATTRYGQELQLRDQELSKFDFELRKQELATNREDSARTRLSQERGLFQERLALGAVERDFVFLAGEIGTGRVPLPFERTASLADILLGNARINIVTTDYGAIYVLRGARDPELTGKLTAYQLNAENVVNLATATEFEMRRNDIIFVAEQPITRWNRAIAQFVIPSIFFQAASVANLAGN